MNNRMINSRTVQRDRSFSFQRLLERGEEKYNIYVTSDVRGQDLPLFLSKFLSPGGKTRILDVGCGSGLLSYGLAKRYGCVVGGDRQPENVTLSERGRIERSIDNMHLTTMDALHLPFRDGAFDGAVMNGVLEWLGVNDHGEDPARLQANALQEVKRVLRPGGILYVGLENRAAIRNLLIDPHVRKPLLSALPRGVADWLSRKLYHQSFQAFIYTPAQLARMLKRAGFSDLRLYTPVPTYQYPFHYVSLLSKAESLKDIEAMDLAHMQHQLEESPLKITGLELANKLKRRSQLGVLKITSLDIAYVCRS
jgi:SAM-dependent methyltransferase